MARINAMTERFEEVEVLGKPALFTCLRVDRNTLPPGLFMYEVREDDGMSGIACQIARNIMVNHWGTIITREPIKLPRDGYLDIDAEDINYGVGGLCTVKEFMTQNPPAKTKYEPER